MSHITRDVRSDEIREELQHLLSSRDFDASDRNRHFLSYIVEETLSGRGDRIKAYSIATSVFGRSADFDPQVDSIVRIEAGRLRRALERYYLVAKRPNGIRIEIPRGTYVPTFAASEQMTAAAGGIRLAHDAASSRKRRSILVKPFEQEDDQPLPACFTRGLTRLMIVGLTRFTDLYVFGDETAQCHDRANAQKAAIVEDVRFDLLLTGGIAMSSDGFTLDVLLSDAQTGRCIWGQTYERHLRPGDIIAMRDEAVNAAVCSMAQLYGVLFGERAREIEGKPPEIMSSYESVIRFYQYWREHDQKLIQSVRDGLERAIECEPHYAEAYACLAQVYVDWVRFQIDGGATDIMLRRRALDLAQRGVELAPHSSRTHHALALVLWFGGDAAAGLAELRAGRALNPNDTHIMADLGFRLAVSAQWEEAVPLLVEAFERNPAQPAMDRLGLALYHYMHGRYRETLTEMRRAGGANMLYTHILVACASAQLGLASEANAAVRAILGIRADYGGHVEDDFRARNVHPDIVAAILEGLRLAGLPGVAAATPRLPEQIPEVAACPQVVLT